MENDLSFSCQIGECDRCEGWDTINEQGDEQLCGCACHLQEGEDGFDEMEYYDQHDHYEEFE